VHRGARRISSISDWLVVCGSVFCQLSLCYVYTIILFYVVIGYNLELYVLVFVVMYFCQLSLCYAYIFVLFYFAIGCRLVSVGVCGFLVLSVIIVSSLSLHQVLGYSIPLNATDISLTVVCRLSV